MIDQPKYFKKSGLIWEKKYLTVDLVTLGLGYMGH